MDCCSAMQMSHAPKHKHALVCSSHYLLCGRWQCNLLVNYGRDGRVWSIWSYEQMECCLHESALSTASIPDHYMIYAFSSSEFTRTWHNIVYIFYQCSRAWIFRRSDGGSLRLVVVYGSASFRCWWWVMRLSVLVGTCARTLQFSDSVRFTTATNVKCFFIETLMVALMGFNNFCEIICWWIKYKHRCNGSIQMNFSTSSNLKKE